MLSLAETALEGTDVACGCETGVEPVVLAGTDVDGVSLLVTASLDVSDEPQATKANKATSIQKTNSLFGLVHVLISIRFLPLIELR